MKKIALVFLAAIVLTNCKKESEESTEQNPTQQQTATQNATPTIEESCYVFDDGANNITLEITEIDEEIKGNLTYAFAEKDKNTGTVTGKIKNGILVLNYTFQSEGQLSKREVAFKIEGKTLLEGSGELNATGTAFKNINQLNFVTKMPLTLTECK